MPYRILLGFIWVSAFIANFAFVSVSAETATGSSLFVCPTNHGFQIEGEDRLKIGTAQEYQVSGLPTEIDPKNITFVLEREGKRVEEVVGKEKYLRLFSEPGSLRIRAFIQMAGGCTIEIVKNVKAYKTLVTYLGWQPDGYGEDVADLLDKRGILFKRIDLPEKTWLLDAPNAISDNLYKDVSAVLYADFIMIGSNDPMPVFTVLEKIGKNSSDTDPFGKKKLFVVTDVSESLLGKLLASSIKHLGLNRVWILRPEGTMDFLLQINTDSEGVGGRWMEYISYGEMGKFPSLWSIVEYVSYEGFPIGFLGLVFSVSVAVLLLNVLKQFVGMNVFGVYNPVLLAVSAAVTDARTVIVFIVLAFLAVQITNFIAKRLYLLYNAKRALLITLYIILSLLCFWIVYLLGWMGWDINQAFSHPFVIFPMFFMIVIADKVFHEDIAVFTWDGTATLFQFILVSGLAFFIIHSLTVRYFLVSFPDVLFLVGIANVAIWRYVGLQLFEYVRFLPLIGNLRDEE